MKKIKIEAELVGQTQMGEFNGNPLYSFQKICDIEAYEIVEDDNSEETVKHQE